MATDQLTRRKLLGAAAGAGTLAMSGVSSGAGAVSGESLDLADPATRAMARAKVVGAITPQVVYSFYRLHVYGYLHDGNLIPFFTMNNLSIGRWEPLENGNYLSTIGECGVYCRFDTDEVLDVWDNPVTGEKRKVWDFVGGPMTVEFGPDGIVTGGAAELSPEVQRMEVMGSKLFVPTAAHMSMPNQFPPEEWPKSSTETTHHWDSLMVAMADVRDVANPDVPSADAVIQFQNLSTWHPWLGLGGYPGRTYGRAYGTKYRRLDEVPATALAGIERRVPQIFDF